MPLSIKILLADDHAIMIDGLKSILEEEPHLQIICECKDGEEVLSCLHFNRGVQVAIIDINMPVMDGIECTRQIKQKHPEVKVLILTMYNDPEFIKRLMEMGADGYLLKNAGRLELLTVIELLAMGETYFGQEIAKTLALSYKLENESQRIQVTRREREVLHLLADGLTTYEISEKLFISTHTVDSHRKNLLSKFGVRNTTSLLREAGEVHVF